MQEKSRNMGLPVFKNLEKPEEKPKVYIEEDDW